RALNEDRELIRRHVLIFVNAGLHVPALEVSAIRAREGTCAESADRRSLPIAIVDVLVHELRLGSSGIGGRLSDGNSPGGTWDGIVGSGIERGNKYKHKREKARTAGKG